MREVDAPRPRGIRYVQRNSAWLRARAAIAAVAREAPELSPDVRRRVAIAVMRACELAVPGTIFRGNRAIAHTIVALVAAPEAGFNPG